jgi:hypothetical protein
MCPACNTFVRHDWTTHCGSCGAEFAQAPAAPTEATRAIDPSTSTSSERKTKSALTLILAGLAVIAVIGGAVTFIGTDSQPTKFTTMESAFNAAPTTTTIDPNVVADTLILPDSALNAKWTAVLFEHVTPEYLSPTGGCFPSDPMMGNTAAAVKDYSYNLQANGLEGGHLDYAVRMSDSTATADHQHQRMNSSEYESCAISNAKETMLAGAGLGAYVQDAALTRVVRGSIPVAYVDYRVTGTVLSMMGINHTTDEVVFMQHGNARLRIEFFDCGCKLGPPPDKDAIINSAAALLAKVPA